MKKHIIILINLAVLFLLINCNKYINTDSYEIMLNSISKDDIIKSDNILDKTSGIIGTLIYLKSNMIINQIPCKGGIDNPLQLYKKSWNCILLNDYNIDNYYIKKNSSISISYKQNHLTELYFDTLKNTVSPLIIDGIPCKNYVKFHINGKISLCMLAKNFKIKNILFQMGSQIEFDENGNLKRAIIYKKHIIHGTEYEGGILEFDKNVNITKYTKDIYG